MRSLEFIALMAIVYYLVAVGSLVILSIVSPTVKKFLQRSLSQQQQHENERF